MKKSTKYLFIAGVFFAVFTASLFQERLNSGLGKLLILGWFFVGGYYFYQFRKQQNIEQQDSDS
ncbi:MAG: hypothetical protein AAF960_20270 [Bacteroidota bacterium]